MSDAHSQMRLMCGQAGELLAVPCYLKSRILEEKKKYSTDSRRRERGKRWNQYVSLNRNMHVWGESELYLKNIKKVWRQENLPGCFVAVNVNIAHMINRGWLKVWLDAWPSFIRQKRVGCFICGIHVRSQSLIMVLFFVQMKMDECLEPSKWKVF